MIFTIGGESGQVNKKQGTIQDCFSCRSTVTRMQRQATKAILGMLEAASSSKDEAIELSNALHPQLWSWVTNGGEDSAWSEAVEALRTKTESTVCGALSDEAGFRHEVGSQSFPTNDYTWVRLRREDEQLEAYAQAVSEGGADPSAELQQLIADAIDGELAGVQPRQAVTHVPANMTSRFYWEFLKRRKNLAIDEYAVELLLKAGELQTASDMLEDVRDGRCTVSSYSRKILAMDSNWRVCWPLLVACGENIQWSWTSEWSWREFAQAVALAPDEKSATALAVTWRSWKQSVYRNKQHSQVYDQKLLATSMRRAADLSQIDLRRRLAANIDARLLGWWLSQPAPVGPVNFSESVDVLQACTAGSTVAKAVDCLETFQLDAARYLLRCVPGLAGETLKSGDVRAGAVLYQITAERLTKSSSWKLFLHLADSFAGTASELAECVAILDS